jgi:hypothetical protein
MLRHRLYVASCVWRLRRAAHWLSSTMLRTCCCLSAARCSPHTKCGSAVCFLVASLMCSRPFACRLLSDARCPLHAVRCLFHVACGLLRAACCMVPCALHVIVVRYILPAAWRMLSGCCLLHACRQVHYPRCICMPSVKISPMHVACCRWSVARFPVVVCGISDRWIVSACPFFVACRTFSVACFLLPAPVPECCMPCAVCRLPRVASRRVARCNTHGLCRMFSLVLRLSRLARRLLHVVCCVLQSDTACCRVTRSRRARSASQRRLQFRAQ